MKGVFSEQIWELLITFWKTGKLEKETLSGYEDQEVKELLHDQFKIRSAIRLSACHNHDIKEGWEKVKNQALAIRRQRRIRRLCSYAAAVAVIVAFTLVFIKQHPSSQSQVSFETAETIQVGKLKAKLFLANGKCLELDNINKDTIVGGFKVELVKDSLTGKLHYQTEEQVGENIQGFNVLDVPKGGEYSFILPDGTRVWLNSESSLRFPVKFSSDRRNVYLTGEGFFKVAQNHKAPFHVHAGGNDIKVLGTEFNVCAYANDRFWTTTLVEGRVTVNDGAVMKPSQQYAIDLITGKHELKTVETEFYTSWVDGKFYFRGFTFEEIVNRLERWYDFKMFYQNDEIRQMRFSGTINKHRPIEEMLQFLEKTTNIRFCIKGKTITASKVY